MNKLLPLFAFSILLLVPLGAQNAYSVPLQLFFVEDEPQCDPLADPTGLLADELGRGVTEGGPFPPDEEITVDSSAAPPSCLSTNESSIDEGIEITNLTPFTFTEVWYVTDFFTTVTNYDGLVNGQEAFRIDSVGFNTPLISESGLANGHFEPGETWFFVAQDYSSTVGSPDLIDSIGVPSVSTSTGSIIAFISVDDEEESSLVAGEIIPIESISLILAGAQSFSWMIPLVLSAVGITIFTISRKN